MLALSALYSFLIWFIEIRSQLKLSSQKVDVLVCRLERSEERLGKLREVTQRSIAVCVTNEWTLTLYPSSCVYGYRRSYAIWQRMSKKRAAGFLKLRPRRARLGYSKPMRRQKGSDRRCASWARLSTGEWILREHCCWHPAISVCLKTCVFPGQTITFFWAEVFFFFFFYFLWHVYSFAVHLYKLICCCF